jgi:hypothetical protein
MQIVWDQTVVEQLKNSHTVLELETFDVKGTPVTTYCVVPAEKVFPDIMQLDNLKEIHAEFVRSYRTKNYKLCRDCAEHLMGRFGGELDTFYQEILSRIKST